jgi:hypothetical protein
MSGRRHSIYFVQEATGGPIKIGMTTTTIEKRLSYLRREYGDLFLLAVISDAVPAVEMHLHDRFHGGHLEGEWFDEETEGLREFIADVGRGEVGDRVERIIAVHTAHASDTESA